MSKNIYKAKFGDKEFQKVKSSKMRKGQIKANFLKKISKTKPFYFYIQFKKGQMATQSYTTLSSEIDYHINSNC